MSRPVISITTDFGTTDYDSGVLTGVIWSIAPMANIAVLTHDITPFNVLEGAVILSRCAPFFPDGAIHLMVVDPGVGTKRRGMAARIGRQYFVGPDNGLITLLVGQVEAAGETCEYFALENQALLLSDITNIFHGRDVFAPAAAHLAAGKPLHAFGSPIHDPVFIPIPQPSRTTNGWRGTILHVDHFGNLTGNITREHLDGRTGFTLTINGNTIKNLTSTYGSASSGELIALLDDSDCLEIAVSQGSAEKRVNAGVGTEFELVFQEKP